MLASCSGWSVWRKRSRTSGTWKSFGWARPGCQRLLCSDHPKSFKQSSKILNKSLVVFLFFFSAWLFWDGFYHIVWVFLKAWIPKASTEPVTVVGGVSGSQPRGIRLWPLPNLASSQRQTQIPGKSGCSFWKSGKYGRNYGRLDLQSMGLG